MSKFIKKVEDFVCDQCGAKIKGNGYTNHCPKCLWSRHVDENPGDRKAECGGLMKPADIYFQSGEWAIIHECEICGGKSKNKILPEDDFDEVVKLEKEINERKVKK